MWRKSRKSALGIREIKRKPMAQARLECRSSTDIKEWFIDYCNWIRVRKIRKAKRI